MQTVIGTVRTRAARGLWRRKSLACPAGLRRQAPGRTGSRPLTRRARCP